MYRSYLPTPNLAQKKDPDGIHILLAESSSQDLEFAKNRAIDKLCLGHHHVLQKGRPSKKHIQGITRVQWHSTH